jgi:hypothetical protein
MVSTHSVLNPEGAREVRESGLPKVARRVQEDLENLRRGSSVAAGGSYGVLQHHAMQEAAEVRGGVREMLREGTVITGMY